MYLFLFFLKRFSAQTVHTGCTRINYRTVLVTNFDKYLHYGTSGTELCVYIYIYTCVCVCVCVQITALKNYEQKNTATSGKLIKAVCASYVYVYIFVQVS